MVEKKDVEWVSMPSGIMHLRKERTGRKGEPTAPLCKQANVPVSVRLGIHYCRFCISMEGIKQ